MCLRHASSVLRPESGARSDSGFLVLVASTYRPQLAEEPCGAGSTLRRRFYSESTSPYRVKTHADEQHRCEQHDDRPSGDTAAAADVLDHGGGALTLQRPVPDGRDASMDAEPHSARVVATPNADAED